MTGFDGDVTAELTLSREAAFDNILKFYETDAEGTVAGLKLGDEGYEDAVRTVLIDELDLFVDNLARIEESVVLTGGTYYAPALLVDGDVHNLVTINDGVTGISRIEREGNEWRFEDWTDFLVLNVNSLA